MTDAPQRAADEAATASPPIPGEADWLALVETTLKGRGVEAITTTTRDGIELSPLYLRSDGEALGEAAGLPGQAPFTRGVAPAGRAEGAWDIRTVVRSADPAAASAAALGDLTGGATSLTVRFDEAARLGLAPGDDAWQDHAGVDGLLALGVDALDAALKGVVLEAAPVVLDAGASFECAAELLTGVWQRRGIDPAEAVGAFRADPVGALAAAGTLPGGIDAALAAASRLAARTHEAFPEVSALGIDTAPHAEAGCTPAQQLAAMLGTGRAVLAAVTEGGLSLEAALAQINITVTLDADIWGGVALLRAARRCWSHLALSAGATEGASAAALHARTSAAMMTRRDPWVNLLRGTAATFAGALGGAESITVAPFDSAVGESDGFARRLARNTQLLAQDESGLGRIIDPAGGSWYVESLTDSLCGRAWELFVEIEGRGGMVEALTSGWWGDLVGQARDAALAEVATRARPVTGVSEFPLLAEEPLARPAPDLGALRAAALAGADAEHGDPAATATELPAPLGMVRWAEGWEALRQRSDDTLAATGTRPRVFVANLGPAAAHSARLSWTTNAFEAGGMEAVGAEGYDGAEAVGSAFAGSGARLAVLCSSDAIYAEWGADAVAALAAHHPARLYVAGRHGAHFDAVADDIDAYVGVGVDLLAALGDAQDATQA
ncbi:MAG: methylmalonyl-CoA mutase family protein [Microthrixaceae bacterium]